MSGDDARELTVVLDVRDPFSYLALGPARALADDARIRIDWLPIRAHVLRPPSQPAPDDDRGIRHRRARAEMLAREVRVYADAQGLEIGEFYRDGSASALHEAWLWLRSREPERLPDFLDAAFRSYWSGGLDPGSPGEVSRLLAESGADADGFERWDAMQRRDALAEAASLLSELGVGQAPAYVLGDEIFLGRQHLPMIRWLLDGGAGARPI